MEKTYTQCGISTGSGVTKVRFANDPNRTKVLIKAGHLNIKIIDLPNPMTKSDALLFIADRPEFQNELAQITIATAIDRPDSVEVVKPKPKTEPNQKAIAVAKSMATVPNVLLEDIKRTLANKFIDIIDPELEDQPF